MAGITAYDFQPSSNIASIYGSCDPNPCLADVKMNSEVEVKGYWTGSSNATYSDFNPGVYTVVGGDEWGALTILYFTVATTPVTSSSNLSEPVEVISVSDTYKAGQTVNPGGPEIEVTLKNVADESIVSLAATLNENRPWNWDFDFGVTPAHPLLPEKSISAKSILISGGFGDDISYSLTINGTLENGTTFGYTWEPPNK